MEQEQNAKLSQENSELKSKIADLQASFDKVVAEMVTLKQQNSDLTQEAEVMKQVRDKDSDLILNL